MPLSRWCPETATSQELPSDGSWCNLYVDAFATIQSGIHGPRARAPRAFSQLVGGGEGGAGPPVIAPNLKGSLKTDPWLDSWIRIAADGHITVFSGKAELGRASAPRYCRWRPRNWTCGRRPLSSSPPTRSELPMRDSRRAVIPCSTAARPSSTPPQPYACCLHGPQRKPGRSHPRPLRQRVTATCGARMAAPSVTEP